MAYLRSMATLVLVAGILAGAARPAQAKDYSIAPTGYVLTAGDLFKQGPAKPGVPLTLQAGDEAAVQAILGVTDNDPTGKTLRKNYEKQLAGALAGPAITTERVTVAGKPATLCRYGIKGEAGMDAQALFITDGTTRVAVHAIAKSTHRATMRTLLLGLRKPGAVVAPKPPVVVLPKPPVVTLPKPAASKAIAVFATKHVVTPPAGWAVAADAKMQTMRFTKGNEQGLIELKAVGPVTAKVGEAQVAKISADTQKQLTASGWALQKAGKQPMADGTTSHLLAFSQGEGDDKVLLFLMFRYSNQYVFNMVVGVPGPVAKTEMPGVMKCMDSLTLATPATPPIKLPVPKTTGAYVRFRNKDFAASFEMPSTWIPQISGNTIAITPPKNSGQVGLMIRLQKMPHAPGGQHNTTAASVQQVEAMINGNKSVSLVKKSNLRIGGYFTTSVEMKILRPDGEIKSVQTVFTVGQNTYWLGFQGPAKLYRQFQPIFDTCLSSLRIHTSSGATTPPVTTPPATSSGTMAQKQYMAKMMPLHDQMHEGYNEMTRLTKAGKKNTPAWQAARNKWQDAVKKMEALKKFKPAK